MKIPAACALILAFLISAPAMGNSKVFLVKTTDRSAGIRLLLKASPLPELAGKKVVIKPNFNSNDPYPATTHLDTLRIVIEMVKEKGPRSITIIERSGMGNTEKLLKSRGVAALAEKMDVRLVDLDRLPKDEWVKKGESGTHWHHGYLVPKLLLAADYVINLPCLKTHRFGGDFTLSLKNNVGTVAKADGIYNYMWELHTSPDQRLMIAEINKDIPCDLVIMDGIKSFITGGPDKGDLAEPSLLLLSTDRVAIDAVGVAILRSYNTTAKVSSGRIFDQEQIKRAAELGIGVDSPARIELVPIGSKAEKSARELSSLLSAQ